MSGAQARRKLKSGYLMIFKTFFHFRYTFITKLYLLRVARDRKINWKTCGPRIRITIKNIHKINCRRMLHESLFSFLFFFYTSLSFNNITAKLTNQLQRTRLYNIGWQQLFTWLWRWLPLRYSKRQSPTTVHFRIQNYSHQDDRTIRTTDTPEFKPFIR